MGTARHPHICEHLVILLMDSFYNRPNICVIVNYRTLKYDSDRHQRPVLVDILLIKWSDLAPFSSTLLFVRYLRPDSEWA